MAAMKLSGDDPLDLRPRWAANPQEPLLDAERRVRLYLGIARRVRKYAYAREVRRAAVEQAWAARAELRARNSD